MAWISPTGWNDIDDAWKKFSLITFDWTDPPDNINDGNVVTGSGSMTSGESWSSFYGLTISEISCNSVRLYATKATFQGDVDLDVYYDGDWHHIYQGAYDDSDWVEKVLDDTYVVTAARLRFYNNYGSSWRLRLHEFEFFQVVSTVTTEAATQIAYQCAMGNGTITSGTNATERGFEIRLDFGELKDSSSGTLANYIDHSIAGFTGDVTWDIVFKWNGILTKTESETGDFAEGAYELVLGYPSVLGNPSSVFNDKLFKCESYTYRAYAIIDSVTYYGEYVAFSTLCDSGGDQQPTDDISEGDPTVPIIPIEPEILPEVPPFEWEEEEPVPYPPWEWDIPPYENPDYPPYSWVGDFYYRKPYTKKDLEELRAKCIIYNKNSVEFALVLRHNMNVLREFFNMMTDYMDKEEFNDFTDLIPPQRLKELYLDPLEVNDFKDMINGFIRNTVDNNIAVNRNFSLIQEGLSDYETGSDDAYFTDISSAMKTITEDDPDVDTLKRVVDNLNQETASNFNTIMHNLEILRARLL